jgi:hypothetical protein
VDVEELYGPFGDSITRVRREVLAQTVSQIRRAYLKGKEWDCYVLWESITELEEQLWMQLQLDAPVREAIKRFQRAERIENERQRDLPE